MNGWAHMDRTIRWEKWRCPGWGRKPAFPYMLAAKVRCVCGYEGRHPLRPSAKP